MMLIQTPGSFVWSASLAARLGIEGWSTWGVFLVTGCLQGCLLVMGICFEIKARRERGAEIEAVRLSQPMAFDGIMFTNTAQVNGRGSTETDDEGGTTVEDGLSENTPLLNGSRKSSRTPAPK